MRRRNRNGDDEDNGFAAWGGYMEAKKAKLSEQFNLDTSKHIERLSDIFKGVSILVNGYTKPSADELKQLMAEHGGSYHMYQNQAGVTTHIIASNLPNVKINNLGSVPIVKPDWISESVIKGRQLNYRKYLLYGNQSRTQPQLNFSVVNKTNPPKIETGNNEDVNAEINTLCNIIATEVKEQPVIVNGKNSDVCGDTSKSNCILNNKNKTCESKLNCCGDVPKITVSANKPGQSKPCLTASDPRFLAEFYNNSRLHLISTLGAEFKQMVNDMREKSNGIFPGKEKLLLNYKRDLTGLLSHNTVIMHIDMDCFFVSVGLRQRPNLCGKPVAVTHSRGAPNRSGVDRQAEVDLYLKRMPEGAATRLDQIDNNCSLSEIASCSYEARKCGIKNGMFLGAALKLCPDLIPIPYDFQGYRDVSSALYKTIAEYTLDIEAVSCDEMYVDVTKILQETGLSVYDWASHIRNEIMTITGCPCSTGFGSNRLQARLATRKAKPAGQYYLQPEDAERYMQDLFLEDLPGVGRATLAKLHNMGLRTCGDVQQVSLSMLRTELGHKMSETIYEQAKGVDQKPLSFEHERKSVSAEVNYGIRFKSNEEALTFIESLANEVHSRLLDTKMNAKCVTLKLMVRAPEAPKETAKFLGHGFCDSLSRSTTTNYLINDPKIIFKEAKSLYSRLNVLAEDLRGVGIQLSRLERGTGAASCVLTKFLNQSPSKKYSEANSCNKNVTNVSNVLPDTTHKVEISESKFTSQCGMDAGLAVNPTGSSVVWKNNESNNKNSVSSAKSKKSINVGHGQPRCSDISKSKIGKTNVAKLHNDIGNYFKCERTEKHGKQLNARNVNIDLNVLKELPEDLRNEIIREYNLDNIESNDTSAQDKLETVVKEDLQSSKKVANKPQNKEKRKGFEDLTEEELRSLLRNWIHNEEVPREADINMLGDFFKSLAVDRRIEKLFPLINFLHRHIMKTNCIWHEAYFKVINYVQEGMVARFGNTLRVPREFCCQKHLQ